MQFIDIPPSPHPGLSVYISAVCVFRNARERKRVLEARRGVPFSAEIPIRMRIDMRIRHGNANRGERGGGIGHRAAPSRALTIFFSSAPPHPSLSPRLDCDRRAVGSEHERSELFGETTERPPPSKLVDAYMADRTVGFLFHSMCAHSSSNSSINLSEARVFSRRRSERERERGRGERPAVSRSPPLARSRSGLKSFSVISWKLGSA